MQAAPDLNSLGLNISSKITAVKTAVETLTQEKNLKKSVGNSTSPAASQITSQLDKIKDLQKRYQREPQTSMDKLLGFLGQTSGQGSSSIKYLRKKILEASVQIEPKVSVIIKEQSIKALGCSQEQTYPGIDLNITPINSTPASNTAVKAAPAVVSTLTI
jgi:hypothetical protein